MAEKPKGGWTAITAVGSLAAALSCCLPLGTFMMAAGSAGLSAFSDRLRPWLTGLSVVLLGVAFVQTYVRSRCAFRHRALRTVLLSYQAAVIAATLLFPQYTSAWVADRFGSASHRATETGRLQNYEAKPFGQMFDAAQASPRVIALFSPT